jgi:High potential iron-sulfur protein
VSRKDISHDKFIQLDKRRRLSPFVVEGVPLIAGAIISTNAVAQNLFAQAKVTHEAAKYQDHPNNGQQCSNCVQFVAPASCKVVEDPIGASGWCQLFMAKPA